MLRDDELTRTLDAWVTEGTHGETVPGPARAGRTPAGWSVTGMLRRLWDSREPLPDEVGAALRLPGGTTYGETAQLLWWLRTSPRFGCSSYVEVVRLLRRLDRTLLSRLHRRITTPAAPTRG